MIRTSLRSCLARVIVCQLLMGGITLAGPQEDVAAASMKWAAALAENDPDKVLPRLKVAFGEQLIRIYGSTAVNTGYYTFSFVRDGEARTLPARYSFTYVNQGKNWMIVDHHSSAMPQPPK